MTPFVGRLNLGIGPNCRSFRVLTGQEPKRHFGLIRLDPDKRCPTMQKSQPERSTTGLIHPYEVRHLTISEIKLLSSFPPPFRIDGSFTKKWSRVGNCVPPLLIRAIAQQISFQLRTFSSDKASEPTSDFICSLWQNSEASD